MEKSPSFRDILFMHLSQKSPKTEAKTSHFDPTFHELNLCLHAQFQFFPRQNTEIYRSKALPKEKPQPTIEHPTPVIKRYISGESFSPKQRKAWETFQHLAVLPTRLPLPETDYKMIYRKTVKALHPDLGGDSKSFVELVEASKCLETAFTPIDESLNSAAA